MTADGTLKSDVKVPEGDIGKAIQEDHEQGKEILVTIVSSMGEEQVHIIATLFPFQSNFRL